ncbi:CTLH/CRA C-terminal to lish motif domain-domain-containing protein [Lobosporangium transversale]|uniref:CTLH/CRA C-terminal to lish motif domain-domain-containing protein n=1 Tax=Lobosporangium transversale TaxID=64571 RepID=A0A1Y2GRA0_9FUNG|nr:CTLH/CRA C-terminal to lish motif domain-domain-containing protein [Lobosporangium transversale]ORZ20056.1 CTLH/CRA C-terminal to lish motif domain-domain-containing protein [Lobosporangium transversale]|eukprot:XP_021882596.1 CTLH/CRA C-terminal to lish motif domain-domain-containing protein [Lobosporangium transversale]
MDLDSELHDSSKIDTTIPRQLVLDYLLHNCYGETARAFMKDDLDAAKVSDGRKNGSTRNASNGTCNMNHYSSSNGTNSYHNGISTVTTTGQFQGIMARNASDDSQNKAGDAASLMETDREELDQEGDSPMGENHHNNTDDSLSNGTLTADKAYALHIDEQLKNLETRKAIRSLISHGDIGSAMELCNSAFPRVLSIDPHSPYTTQASIQMNFKLQCQKFIELVKADPGPDALDFAKNVIDQFTQLDPDGKEGYIKQMEDVFSVIAYVNPEESPNGHFLKQEARDQLADTLNSAVLGCNGMSCEPALLTIVKQATLVRECLAGDTSKTKRGLKAPPRWRLSTFLEESS